jgi:D-amino-acid oxidase
VGPLVREDYPAPGIALGWRTRVPVVDPGRYLPYLRHRLVTAGGTLTRLSLSRLPEQGLVVNCTGLSARALVPDPSVRAMRIQTVLLADPGLTEWWYGAAGPDGGILYVVPRGRDLVIGLAGVADEWSTVPDPAVSDSMLSRARTLVPAVRDCRVLGHRVGLQPDRVRARVDVTRLPGGRARTDAMVHCYGHGPTGITTSWGCADEVAHAVARILG